MNVGVGSENGWPLSSLAPLGTNLKPGGRINDKAFTIYV